MNTLFTKLPSSVTDSSLRKTDEIRLHVKLAGEPLSRRNFTINNGGIAKIPCRIVGDGNFVDSSDNVIGKEVNASLAVPTYLSAGEYDVYIGDKYRLTEVFFNAFGYNKVKLYNEGISCLPKLFQLFLGKAGAENENGKLNLADYDTTALTYLFSEGIPSIRNVEGSVNDLKNIANMTRIGLSWQSVKGGTEGFLNAVKATNIDITGNDITGSIDNFKNCTKVTSLNVSNTAISGTLESLLSKMAAAGRTTGSCTFSLQASNVTYNGVVPTAAVTINFPYNG